MRLPVTEIDITEELVAMLMPRKFNIQPMAFVDSKISCSADGFEQIA